MTILRSKQRIYAHIWLRTRFPVSAGVHEKGKNVILSVGKILAKPFLDIEI